MSQEGVLKANHKQYLRIMSINKNVNIYYQYKAPLTHIKAYVFLTMKRLKALWALQTLQKMDLYLIMNYYVKLMSL